MNRECREVRGCRGYREGAAQLNKRRKYEFEPGMVMKVEIVSRETSGQDCVLYYRFLELISCPPKPLRLFSDKQAKTAGLIDHFCHGPVAGTIKRLRRP